MVSFFSFFVPSRSLNSLTGNALHFRSSGGIKNEKKEETKGFQKNKQESREREAWGVLNVPSQDTLAQREAVKVIVREHPKRKKKTAPKLPTSVGSFVLFSLSLSLFFPPERITKRGKMENTRRRGREGLASSHSHQTTHKKKKIKNKFKHPKMCVCTRERERERGVSTNSL